MAPSKESFRFPAEWEPHQACWLAWPSHLDLWREQLPYVQEQFIALCQAIAWVPPGAAPACGKPREKLQVLVPFDQAKREAEKALSGLPVEFHDVPFGDIWLRDTAPLFVRNWKNELVSQCFQFNGWGNKYLLEFDPSVSGRIAQILLKKSGIASLSQNWVLEGGSIDVDGLGTALSTKQCLLNPNRNPHLSQVAIEQELDQSLGIKKVIWLNHGLLNDHTDGHVDNIARFVAPSTVVCMEPSVSPSFGDDPNAQTLLQIKADLEGSTDAQGNPLRVVCIPSPGCILGEQGQPIPASYMNFYISNFTVVVPIYGSRFDEKALERISRIFPDRRTIGLKADAILKGGGSFHCISQQLPLGEK